ncbi:methyltransferase domain-containing protein [Vallitaleaceae bacterium 9-2]
MDNKQKFDDLAVEYDFISEIFNNNDYFLANLSIGKKRALDIGCGSGVLMNALSKHFDEVIGIDISENMLEIGRSKRNSSNIKFINMNATNITLTEKFDFIVSRTTLHHIKDKDVVIERFKSMLVDNGKIVMVDNVSEKPTPKRSLNIAGAYIDFLPNILKYGYSKSIRILRHSTSKEWLDHLASDVYLSERETRNLYKKTLPGSSVRRFGCFMGVVWEKSTQQI